MTNYQNTTLSDCLSAPFAESLTAPKRVQQPVSSGSFSSNSVKETFSQQFQMQNLLVQSTYYHHLSSRETANF